MTNTIKEVVRQGLCTGCGTCIAVCPKGALTLVEDQKSGTYLPKLDSSKCDQCGVCLLVCPGIGIDFKKLNSFVFGKEPEDILLGNYIDCYAGYASDQKLRYNASSGGLVTALASFALETGEVDGVLVTKMDPEKPLKPKPFIAKSKQELVSAIGSKYCPVPANILLKEILKEQGHYIVVGLPCHIQGVRKAQALIKKLRDRIRLCFGLACNHTPTFQATKYLLKKLRISEDAVVKLDYRGKGWPGGMGISLDDGSEIFVPQGHKYYWGLVFNRFFWPDRCILCEDKLCELADITFMDAWLPEFSSDKIGTSLIVVRSKKGNELIDEAVKHEIIKLQDISVEKIIESQSMKTRVRKIVARKLISQLLFCKALPCDRFTFKPTFLDLLDALHFTVTNKICKNNLFSQFLIDCHVIIWDIARLIKKLL
ncbi:MAG: FeS-binding protein [Candidatus Aenigmatarchaeota archaeon]|nr:MAG: FeS-binding protein [Candidatus Aenigmarchaeota archaeon]